MQLLVIPLALASRTSAGARQGDDRIVSTKINIIQVNLNKAHGAQVELLNKINKLGSYIAFVTEPYCYKKNLSIPPKNSYVLPTNRKEHPRAAIFSSKDIVINEISELCHRDMAIGIAKMEGRTTVLVSLYLDINQSPTPDFLVKALEYSKNRGYSMLIGSDTNSHSTLWGKESNIRGEQLEELIDTYNLDIHNRRKMPTYDCSLGQSIIDVTLSMDLKIAVENWKVCKVYNLSLIHI